MSEKEIKDLAYQYVKASISPEYKSPDLALEIRTREREIASFLKFLSERYCIVEKSKVLEEYQFWEERLPKKLNLAKEVQNVPDTARMFEKIEILNDLFGKELFSDTEQ